MYGFDGRVRYSETDERCRLSVTALINYFQDASTFHGEDVGTGVRYFEGKNRAWFLAAWEILIHRLPKLGEEIQVRTWPYQFRGIYGFRNFRLQSPSGEVFAEADSLWFLFDTAENRPVKADPEDISGYQKDAGERLPMPPLNRKIAVPEGGVTGTAIPIGKHHLDTNHHVNNAQYVEIAREAAEALGEQGAMELFSDPARIDVQYKKAVGLGETLTPVIHLQEAGAGSDPVCLVDLKDRAGESCAVVRVEGRTAQ